MFQVLRGGGGYEISLHFICKYYLNIKTLMNEHERDYMKYNQLE